MAGLDSLDQGPQVMTTTLLDLPQRKIHKSCHRKKDGHLSSLRNMEWKHTDSGGLWAVLEGEIAGGVAQ